VLWNADVAAEQPLLGPLLSSLLERRRVAFDYETADGSRSTRSLEPYGLVHRRGHWYLVGRDIDREAPRSFKVSRITGPVVEIQGSYEIPSDFDVDSHVPAEAWEVGDGDGGIATVRFDAQLRWWPEQNMPNATMTEGPDGSLVVEMPITRVDGLVTWLVGFGEGIEVVGPPEVRRAVVEHLEPLLAGS
jgi:proteasome accessory factor B